MSSAEQDMRAALQPKSDQINAEDLRDGPLTITVTGARVMKGKEQPIVINFEGSKRAYKPCKTMGRIIAQTWGFDPEKYAGGQMTLFCDPSVSFGPSKDIGGIRISHISGIDSPRRYVVHETRGSKKPVQIRPIEDAPRESFREHVSLQAQREQRQGGEAFDDQPSTPDFMEKVREIREFIPMIEGQRGYERAKERIADLRGIASDTICDELIDRLNAHRDNLRTQQGGPDNG